MICDNLNQNLMATKFDLDGRLILFAAEIIDIVEALPKSIAANHLGAQLVRSGTAPSLNYGEAQGAESRNDFVHKMKVALKELRETYCCLRIIQHKKWLDTEKINSIVTENNQLIAIFVKSIETAQKNTLPKQMK
jgi:four helix bundle protein